MGGGVAVVGAGWAGAAAARFLHDHGARVTVYEQSSVVGGHSRSEVLNGVLYEPNGAHIFHTSDLGVARFVRRFGMSRRYEHRVLSEVYLDDDAEHPVLLSWPPQVDELEALPIWPQVERELAELPPRPCGEDLESYVVSLMGPTLYRRLVRDYSRKQWGCDPALLSSKMAPTRIELRRDGNRRLFRDRFEFFPSGGMNSVIESMLAPVPVVCGARIGLADVASLRASAVVITAPLDEFASAAEPLAWRGISMRSRYVPVDHERATVTPGYVVNRPSMRVPYTRTVESKHASGQAVMATVVSEERPGAPSRHYPVATLDGRYEAANERLKLAIRVASPVPVFFCGRLANYCYINQDQAIAQGLATAKEVLDAHGKRHPHGRLGDPRVQRGGVASVPA